MSKAGEAIVSKLSIQWKIPETSSPPFYCCCFFVRHVFVLVPLSTRAASALLPSIFIKLSAGCGRFPRHASALLPPFVCSLSAGSRPAGAAVHGMHQGAGQARSTGRATRASPRHLLQFFLVDVGFFFSFPLNFREFCKNIFCLCLGKEVLSDTR